MKLPVIVDLSDRATGSVVAAQIRRTMFSDVVQWYGWVYPTDSEDRDWDWMALFTESIRYPQRFECYSLIVEGALHCLMRLDLRGKRLRGVRWLIIEYLATNPADRRENAGIKYLGESMLAVDTERSSEHNLSGRLWLESLPEAQGFYEYQGFGQLKRRSKEGFATYLLDSDAASKLLSAVKKRRGWKDAEKV
jgi:hypothetical protein